MERYILKSAELANDKKWTQTIIIQEIKKVTKHQAKLKKLLTNKHAWEKIRYKLLKFFNAIIKTS